MTSVHAAWALSWALLLSLSRHLVSVIWAKSSGPAFEIFLGLPALLFPAILLSVLLFSKSRFLKWLGHVLLPLIIFLDLVAFHYEAYFFKLPSVATLYYLREASQLASSAEANAPIFWVVTEWLVLWTLTLFSLWRFGHVGVRVRARRPVVVVAGSMLLFPILLSWGAGQSGALFWKIRSPFGWLVENSLQSSELAGGNQALSSHDFEGFQRLIGHRLPFGSGVPDAPLCAPPSGKNSKANGRSVILLILESVGENQLDWKRDGRSVMPELQKIAAGNLHFNRFMASGTKSAQAMPSLFAGLPPQTVRNALWVVPPLRMKSFVSDLGGYRRSYFHGSDLSFEQQRYHLKKWGFDEIFELDPDDKSSVLGWGYDDGTMLQKLRHWIETVRDSSPETPYLSTLFTLSTHDPYFLPNDWELQFAKTRQELEYAADWRKVQSVKDPVLHMIETFRFLDEELGKFYRWYRENEWERGTILILLGDHNPHYFEEGIRAGGGETNHFRVPLVIVGKGLKGTAPQGAENRLAWHTDLPATITGLLGANRGACDQGLDLLMPAELWPKGRSIYAVAGDGLEEVYMWNGPYEALLDRNRKSLGLIPLEDSSDSTVLAPKGYLEAMTSAYGLVLNVNTQLLLRNAYAPKEKTFGDGITVEPLGELVVASHRGNVDGPGNPLSENTLDAIQAAINADFEWVEVDVQLTRDGVAVLSHDPVVRLSEKQMGRLSALTLPELDSLLGKNRPPTLEEALDTFGDKIGFLVECKPSRHVSQSMVKTREIARILRERTGKMRLIADGFSRTDMTAIKQYCPECVVGMDAPRKVAPSAEWLNFSREQGLRWIYVDKAFHSAELRQRIHAAGLYEMVYTVNDPDLVKKWKGYMPDGVITDSRVVRDMLR